MKRHIIWWMLCILCSLQVSAVLKEKDLARTLGVLKAELQADCERQQAFMERYSSQSEAQHSQLVDYMQKCEQIGLMLYSQKADYTFDMAYACQQATDLYKNLKDNNLPYDQIKTRLEQEIERYAELIRSLKQLPPIDVDDRDEVMTQADSIIQMAMDSLRAVRDSLAMLNDTAAVASIENIAKGLKQKKDKEKEHLEPYMLNEEQQADRKECLVYADSLKTSLEAFLTSLTNENTYYASVSEKAEKLNDFAKSRYHILQQSIFRNGGKNYLTILSELPRQIRMANRDIKSKYLPFKRHSQNYSEWRGMYVAFISIFLFLYMAIGALLSTLIIRFLMPKRFQTSEFKAKRSMLNAVLGIFIFAISVMIARIFIDRNFILMSTSLMILLAWLLLVIFISFLIRLDGTQVRHAVRIYLPFISMAFVVILFRIILIPNNLVNLIYPPILLGFTIWQVRTILLDRNLLPASDVIYSNISAVAMIVACIASWIGFTLLAVEIMVWWMFQLTGIQTITCIYDLMKNYETNRLAFKLTPSLKEKKDKGEDIAAELKTQVNKMKSGDYINKTWHYDLMRITIVPILAIVSILYSIYWAADIFEMNSTCYDIFVYKFIDQKDVIQLSLYQICIAASLYFIFRFINYFTHSFYRHLRRNVLKMENTYNRTLANNVIGILVWGLYFIIVLVMLKIPKSGISIVTAGLATGMGFAMKDLLENFFYGISLMTGRVRVGDYIECDGIQGKVDSITYQSTQLLTSDGSIIAFLNSALFSKNFKNMTRNHRYELIKIPIGVSYGTNVEKVRQLLIEAITPIGKQRNKEGKFYFDPSQAIGVSLANFGDNSVDLSVGIWMRVEDKLDLTPRVREVIYNVLNENGIEIPFPQRDVHIIQA